jgi:hypothetical protein
LKAYQHEFGFIFLKKFEIFLFYFLFEINIFLVFLDYFNIFLNKNILKIIISFKNGFYESAQGHG